MINQEKTDFTSFTPIRDKSTASIVDWFEQHQQSFYLLGWSYLRNQPQMEELFNQTILKIKKEIHRFKHETSLETWITTIFIHTCRELSQDSSLTVTEELECQDLFKSLAQMEESEREALALTYLVGISKEEAANVLQVSVENLNELLLSGIQSLRKKWGDGAAYHGCPEYQNDYMDYLERSMERPKKIDFEIHVFHCQDCQEDLAAFQEVMFQLSEKTLEVSVPADFIANVKERLQENENHRQRKRRKRSRMALICAGIFALFISVGFFTGMFTYVYYSWTEDNPVLRTYLQAGLGERLSLEAESDGVKIKIKGAIADDVQTLVFYEIEDTKEDNQYVVNSVDGVYVTNQFKIMKNKDRPIYHLPEIESEDTDPKKNVFQGKISLQPLVKDSGTIKLKISKLQKLPRHSADRSLKSVYENLETEIGDWNFEIPVTKQPSYVYDVNQETNVQGIPVRFDKLIIAPTTTFLQYGIKNDNMEQQLQFLSIDHLEIDQKKLKADLYSSSALDSQQDSNWFMFQLRFDSLLGTHPKAVDVHFGSQHEFVEDPQSIKLDPAKEYPQKFQYAGSTISIDKLELGQPTKLVMSNYDRKNRGYESLQFEIMGKDGNLPTSVEMNSEGVVVDRNGVEYDENQVPFVYEKLEEPRYFTTVQRIEVYGDDFIPNSIELRGYNTTNYLDDVVKLTLHGDGSRASHLPAE